MNKKNSNVQGENEKKLEKINKIDKVCRIFAFILSSLEAISLICLIIILAMKNKNHNLLYFLILNIVIGLVILSLIGLEISKCKKMKNKIAQELKVKEDFELPPQKISNDEEEPKKKEESEEEKARNVIPVVLPVDNEKDEEEPEKKEESEEEKARNVIPVVLPVDNEKDEEEPEKKEESEEEKAQKVIPIVLPVTEFDNDEDNYDDLEEIHVVEEVNVESANELMTDSEAAHFIHEKETFISDRTNRGIVNIKQLSRYFIDDEVVTLEGMKVRIPGFDKKLTYVKVLADGVLDKRLKVYADDFSIEAAKMILLTGGRVVRAKK